MIAQPPRVAASVFFVDFPLLIFVLVFLRNNTVYADDSVFMNVPFNNMSDR